MRRVTRRRRPWPVTPAKLVTGQGQRPGPGAAYLTAWNIVNVLWSPPEAATGGRRRRHPGYQGVDDDGSGVPGYRGHGGGGGSCLRQLLTTATA